MSLAKVAAQDERIWVLDGDLADSDGAAHFASIYPDRFVMGGIAEQNLVTMAAGMAACGLRPWVFSFAAFITYRACDQIRVSVSQTELPVTLVGSHAGGAGGRNGKTHQALSDLAVVGTFANIDIWTPGDEEDVRLAVDEIITRGRPAYLRLPREPLERLGGCAVVCRWIGEPEEVAIVGCGFGTRLGLDVQSRLADRGVHAGVINCVRLSPFPARELREMVRDVRHVAVVDDHYRQGGLADQMASAGIAPTSVHAWPSHWSGGSGDTVDLLDGCGLNADRIASVIEVSVRAARPA